MRKPHHIMPDVTQERLDSALEGSDASLLRVEAKRSNWASGDIGSEVISEGLSVHKAQLRGMAGFNADLMSASGLSLEIRLDGWSQSTRADDNLTRKIGPGAYAFSACHAPKLWYVSAPAQKMFRTTSILFSEAFIAGLGDPELTDFSVPMFDNGVCHIGPASASSLALVEQIMTIDVKAPLAKLKLHAICATLLSDCVSLCLSSAALPLGSDEMLVREAKEYIRRNANQALAISDVAAHCGVSSSSLKVAFVSIEGVSIGRHIRTVRMEMAREMLQNGVPIINVSQRLNYSAPEALTRAFSKHFGFPPSQAIKA